MNVAERAFHRLGLVFDISDLTPAKRLVLAAVAYMQWDHNGQPFQFKNLCRSVEMSSTVVKQLLADLSERNLVAGTIFRRSEDNLEFADFVVVERFYDDESD